MSWETSRYSPYRAYCTWYHCFYKALSQGSQRDAQKELDLETWRPERLEEDERIDRAYGSRISKWGLVEPGVRGGRLFIGALISKLLTTAPAPLITCKPQGHDVWCYWAGICLSTRTTLPHNLLSKPDSLRRNYGNRKRETYTPKILGKRCVGCIVCPIALLSSRFGSAILCLSTPKLTAAER